MQTFLMLAASTIIVAWIVWPLKHEAPTPEQDDIHGGVCVIFKGTSECIELEPLNYTNIVLPS